MLTKTKKGKQGEEYAVRVLKKLGYKIIKRNFNCRFGEIDIIATHNGILKFLEVKARWSTKYGKPEEAITPAKLRNIIKTLEYFLHINKYDIQNYQIEVIAIDLSPENKPSFKIISYV